MLLPHRTTYTNPKPTSPPRPAPSTASSSSAHVSSVLASRYCTYPPVPGANMSYRSAELELWERKKSQILVAPVIFLSSRFQKKSCRASGNLKFITRSYFFFFFSFLCGGAFETYFPLTFMIWRPGLGRKSLADSLTGWRRQGGVRFMTPKGDSGERVRAEIGS